MFEQSSTVSNLALGYGQPRQAGQHLVTPKTKLFQVSQMLLDIGRRLLVLLTVACIPFGIHSRTTLPVLRLEWLLRMDNLTMT